MKMNKKQHQKVNICLFFFLILGVVDPLGYSEYIYDYTCVIRAMLDLMIIPGVLMFYRYREKWLQDEIDVP